MYSCFTDNSFGDSNHGTQNYHLFQTDKDDSVILLLHGNPIAHYLVADRVLYVCDGNHQTVTTKERLNGLPGVSVHQKAGQWYLNGEKWDGYWTKIGSLQ